MRLGSLLQFDGLAAGLPSLCSQRNKVAATLRAHQQRWDDADRPIGYTATRQEEAAASADEESLIAKLFAADATSLRGLSAKHDVLIAVGAEGAEGWHFPWPELRRIRRDVARLVQLQTQRDATFTAGSRPRNTSAGNVGADAPTPV